VFNDGTRGEIDLKSLIFKDSAGVFKALRDKDLFNQLYLHHGALTWPNGLDLAPDALYEKLCHTEV
jgi:Protein of unknown function (DUF2442)